MEKPVIEKDFIDGLLGYRRDKDNLIDNPKVHFACDVCSKQEQGAHIWVKDEKWNPEADRLKGYDWLNYPNGWLVLWTSNGQINVCSKICAVRLNTDLFYDEEDE